MKFVTPRIHIIYPNHPKEILKRIEQIGRVCYRSEDSITDSSAADFCRKIVRNGHESVLEHMGLSMRITCDRGISHELVRHRLASFSQESTRYCNYGPLGFTFVIPEWFSDESKQLLLHKPGVSVRDLMLTEGVWFETMLQASISYTQLLAEGWTPQQARSILPNSLKTEIWITTNFRELRHILKLRAAPSAHPQMVELMLPLWRHLAGELPELFLDIDPRIGNAITDYTRITTAIG